MTIRTFFKLFVLMFSLLTATACEFPEVRLPLPEDAPQLGCDFEAPFGSEFCEGDWGNNGSLLLLVTPDESGVNRPHMELFMEYRHPVTTDNEWVTVDHMPSFFGDERNDYWVTMPGAGPGYDIRIYGNLIFTGVTTKRLFCEDSPSGTQDAWIGKLRLDTRPMDDCYWDIDTDDLD